MAGYRYRLFTNGKSAHEGDYDCRGDLEALGTAKKLSVDFEVEVWDGERRVAYLEKEKRLSWLLRAPLSA
jgi:hypothetical protein